LHFRNEITGFDAQHRPGDDKSKFRAKVSPLQATFVRSAFFPGAFSPIVTLGQIVGPDLRGVAHVMQNVTQHVIQHVTQHVMQQIPTDQLDSRTPGGERTIRDLGYHIFRLSLVFRDAAVEDRFPEAWLLEKVPAELGNGQEIAGYGALVRAKLEQWFTEHTEESFSRTVHTYYGPQSLHALLERTTWHAAQHFRQVYALLEGMGIAPDQPLTAEDYAGLPLPEILW